ncbi:3643_t:CDS:2 [Funneliformis mosseae]|uniref:3643_t:CDS:1 n=1 Tax=Funneliformis mosseae TaxID=27381 RepID=A0A9N9ASV2_FUNMO|nr:3643_t:CDS:2 [Funneliformis mosseae]
MLLKQLQNSINIKVIEDKKIDSFYPEEPASSKLPEEKKKDPDSEIHITSLDSTTSLNEKNGQGCSPIANEQGLRHELSAYIEGKKGLLKQTGEVIPQSDKAFDIEISEFFLEVILTGSSKVTVQNIVDLFRVAIKTRQKEILC